MKHTKNNKGFASPFMVGALAIAIIGGGLYFYIEHKNAQNDVSTQKIVDTTPSKDKVKVVVVTKPIIKSVAPLSGKVGSKVTISGLNFDSKVNGVMFVSKAGTPVSTGFAAYPTSADGKTVTFEVPSQLSSCPITSPSCPMLAIAQNLVTPRAYTVTVVTEKGSSNYGEFTVTK